MSIELLDALYKKFGTSKEGMEKFLKHAKNMLEDGDISEKDLKNFIKDKNIGSKVEEDEPVKKPKKAKVKTFKDLFSSDETDKLFKPKSSRSSYSSSSCGGSSVSSGCGNSAYSSGISCGSSSSSSNNRC